MRHPIISIALCFVALTLHCMLPHAHAKASNTLLSLAEEDEREPMSLAERQAAFPALAQLSADLGCVLTVGDPHAIAEDFYGRLGEEAGFAPENIYSIKGIAIATTTRGYAQWMRFGSEVMRLLSDSLYMNYLSEGNRQALATAQEEPTTTQLLPDEPLYFCASFESEESRQLHELMESISQQADSATNLLSFLGVAASLTKTDTQIILSIDLKKSREALEKRDPENAQLAWLARCPQEKMHLVISQRGPQLHFVITPTLGQMRLTSDVSDSLLASDKLPIHLKPERALPYAMIWVDEEAIGAYPPALLVREEIKTIRNLLFRLASVTADEEQSGIYQQASLALAVVENTFFQLIPDIEHSLSCLIWADDAIHADIASGIADLHRAGELRHLEFANAPQTALYVEGTPFVSRDTRVGLVKYTMNAFHVLEGLALAIDAERYTEVVEQWSSLRSEYFPVIVQYVTGLHDVVRGMGLAAGMKLALSADEQKIADYYAFCSVDQFAPLSSGWSQILASLEKLNELRMGGSTLSSLYTASLGTEPNTMSFIRTTKESDLKLPTRIDLSAHYASLGSCPITDHTSDARGSAHSFGGAVYMLRFQPFAEILRRSGEALHDSALFQRLAQKNAVLYGVNVQREGRLYTRLKLSTDPRSKTQ